MSYKLFLGIDDIKCLISYADYYLDQTDLDNRRFGDFKKERVNVISIKNKLIACSKINNIRWENYLVIEELKYLLNLMIPYFNSDYFIENYTLTPFYVIKEYLGGINICKN